MISSIYTFNTKDYQRQTPQQMQNSSTFQELYLDRSEIVKNTFIASQKFGQLNSFSLRNFIVPGESYDKAPIVESQEHFQQVFISQDPIYSVLSLKRGYSEAYNSQEIARDYFAEFATNTLEEEIESIKSKDFSPIYELPYLQSTMMHNDSQGESKIVIHTSDQTILERVPAKISSKNVTKNMGKLLFKFIWKNRLSLRHNIKVSDQEWDQFITLIRSWKGQNNITRNFLIDKWHANQPSNKIFRTISHHFFRTKCITAVFHSKIEDKQMHLQRLSRFQEGTVNPKALDNLN